MSRHARPGVRRRLGVFVLALVVSLLLAIGPLAALVERGDALLVDVRLRLAGPQVPPAEVVFVRVGEAELAQLGGWPVPRRFWAEVIEGARAAGAHTIVLDTLLAPRPSAAGPRGDRPLAAAMARHGRVLLPLGVTALTPGAETDDVESWAYAVVVQTGPGVDGPAHRFTRPPGVVTAAAAALAPSIIDRPLGAGPLLLRAALSAGDDVVPSLAVEAVRVNRGVARGAMWYDTLRGTRLDGAALAPAHAGHYLLMAYGPPGAIATVSATAVAAGEVALDGALVVIGVDAAAVGERFVTAFAPSLSGGEALATGIANLLEGRTLRRLEVASPLGLGLILAAAAVGAAGFGRAAPRWALVFIMAAVAALASLGQAALVGGDLWVPMMLPLAALFTAALAVEGIRLRLVQEAERELAFERRNLARYFPPAVVDRLAAAATVTALDRTVEATVMFIDAVGSSTVVERLPPADAMATFRELSRRIEAAVFAEGGTLVAFMGDGAMVAFGAVEPRPDAPAAALRAAHRLLGLASEQPLTLSIGIHHGPVLAGNVGGVRQFQFTVVGDVVHVASRLEGLTRSLDAAVVASTAVLDRIDDPTLVSGFVARPQTALRGRAATVDIAYLPRCLIDANNTESA